MQRKLATLALGVLILASPVFVSAQTVNNSTSVSGLIQLYTQLLQLLESEIASLTAETQLSVQPPPTATTVPAITATTGLSATIGTPLTASLTANGANSSSVAAGTSVNYVWASTYATSAHSTFTVDSADACGDQPGVNYPWTADTLNGSNAGATQSCHAGHTYTITFYADY